MYMPKKWTAIIIIIALLLSIGCATQIEIEPIGPIYNLEDTIYTPTPIIYEPTDSAPYVEDEEDPLPLPPTTPSFEVRYQDKRTE